MTVLSVQSFFFFFFFLGPSLIARQDIHDDEVWSVVLTNHAINPKQLLLLKTRSLDKAIQAFSYYFPIIFMSYYTMLYEYIK